MPPDVAEELKKIRDGIEELKKKDSYLRLFLQVFLAPLVLAAVGFYFSKSLADDQKYFQQRDIEVKDAQAATDLLPHLFIDFNNKYLKLFVTDALIEKFLDPSVKETVHEWASGIALSAAATAAQSVTTPNDVGPATQSVTTLTAINTAASQVDGPAANEVKKYFQKEDFWVVVGSNKKQEVAENFARSFAAKGYPSEVHRSSNEYFAVVLAGPASFLCAKSLADQAKSDGTIKNNDFFIATSSKVLDRIGLPSKSQTVPRTSIPNNCYTKSKNT